MQVTLGQKSRRKRISRINDGIREGFRKEREVKENKSGKLVLLFIAFCLLAWLLIKGTEYENLKIPGWMFILPGLFFLALLVKNLYLQKRALSWPAVKCKILANDVYSTPGPQSSKHPLVYYSYKVDKKEYISYTIYLGELGSSKYSKAFNRASEYKEGTVTKCYYDPDKPSRAVLERKISFKYSILAFSFALCFFFIGFLIGFL